LIPALTFAILTAASVHAICRTDMILQPEKRSIIAWTMLAALAVMVVMLVVAVNLSVRAQAI
jgi:hypothetical protein